jgi:transcription termination factor Rho
VYGILDVRGETAFLRADGYRPGPDDTHVPSGLLRRNQLRTGDAIAGAAKAAQQQKRRSLSRVDTVNGRPPAESQRRPGFETLTPLHPDERLILETKPHLLTTRVIDLVMPVGKGQRALIVSPPKAGKTSVVQAIAQAITVNHPECHVMVVLVDERPEEVTDMRRSVDAEVIASTFDRPPAEHIALAEMAVERAKRRVEQGEDVVLLLDSVTRLGRAYNLAAKASGRILSGGIDSGALHPLKRFLGAARNIENGGSLTMFATAMVENGSLGDTVFFEELKSTGNAELKLDRKIAERRVFPAVDVIPSGTRKEELLLAPEELAIVGELRRALQSREQHAIDHLLEQLRKTGSNNEFLLRLRGSTNEVTRVAA